MASKPLRIEAPQPLPRGAGAPRNSGLGTRDSGLMLGTRDSGLLSLPLVRLHVFATRQREGLPIDLVSLAAREADRDAHGPLQWQLLEQHA